MVVVAVSCVDDRRGAAISWAPAHRMLFCIREDEAAALVCIDALDARVVRSTSIGYAGKSRSTVAVCSRTTRMFLFQVCLRFLRCTLYALALFVSPTVVLPRHGMPEKSAKTMFSCSNAPLTDCDRP